MVYRFGFDMHGCLCFDAFMQGLKWITQKVLCESHSEMNRDTISDLLLEVHVSGEDRVCEDCFQLASQHRFITKVASLVYSLDEAKYLHMLMFSPDEVEDFKETVKASACYLRRSKNQYDKLFDRDVAKLHHHVGCVWHGRLGQAMTETMRLFYAETVQPCLDTEPGHPIKRKCIDRLLLFLTNDPNTSSFDVRLVKEIVTGRLNRHPAIQGVLVASMCKLRKLEEGLTTMRNGKSFLVDGRLLVYIGLPWGLT